MLMATTHQTAVSLFLAYAHEDEPLRRLLETHLSGLQRQGLISIWHDRKIVPGTSWAEEIDEHLEQASIILLLVSADFLASDYCYQVEMQRALERHKADKARVIPIILRPADWHHTPFAKLQALPTDAQAVTIWHNQDEAFVDVTAGIRRAIEDLPLLSASASRAKLPTIWNIPYPRNPFFTGRDELLSQLHTQLHTGQATALSQSPHALSGLGGIGKTQLAAEYAYRYYQDYEAVLWVRAESEETLNVSYTEIARLLTLPEHNAKEQEIVIQAVKTWLQTHRRWLLILDNADDLALLPPFLPPTPGEHILLTTRAWAMKGLATRLEVETLADERGVELLLRRAGRLDPGKELAQASADERLWAARLVQEVGGLPLALDQAGAYLEATSMSLEEYYHVYQHHRSNLLSERGSLTSDHPDAVVKTLSLSFQRVEVKNAAAAELLRCCAYLAPDSIPEELLIQGAKHLGPLLAPVVADAFLLAQAVEVLRAYSLVERDPQSRTLTQHRLVQAVVRDNMPTEAVQQWKQRIVLTVHAACPDVKDFNQRNICERWLPHALVCATWIECKQVTSLEAAHLLNHAGYYLHDHTRYREAEPLLKRALAIYEQQQGPDHPNMARGLNNLAEFYRSQGKYGQAEELLKQAISIYEQQLETNHPDIAASINNLASIYEVQREYKQAEPLLKRALAICEQQMGPDHPNTALCLNNLALLYNKQGKCGQAEPLLKRALAIYEQQQGPDHPNTARGLNNLAEFYRSQGKHGQAEELLKQAISIYEQQQGPDHLNTATACDNLAGLYYDQGRYAQAEPLFQRALVTREQKLGPEHHYTAISLHNLVLLYAHQGKYTQAEPLLKRALAIYEQQLGPDHLDTVTGLANLAIIYQAQGKYEQVKPLLRRALAIYEQQLGSEHPNTQKLRRNYDALREGDEI
jgi:tetratricopeptide (TPR) repeat protein